jgi:hypothetical protein
MSATSRRTRRRANEADTQPVIHLRGAALLQSNFINFRILPERSCTKQQGRARAPMFMLRVHDRIAVLHAVREIVDTLPRPAGAQTLAAKKEQKPPRTVVARARAVPRSTADHVRRRLFSVVHTAEL